MVGFAFYIGTSQHADRSLGKFETMDDAVNAINGIKQEQGKNAKDLYVYQLPVDREAYLLEQQNKQRKDQENES